MICPHEQIELNLSTNRNSEGLKKDIYHGKNIVESKIFQ